MYPVVVAWQIYHLFGRLRCPVTALPGVTGPRAIQPAGDGQQGQGQRGQANRQLVLYVNGYGCIEIWGKT